jgi:hypothetical protein
MISIVDATELRYVLRPTVYRPPSEPADRSVTVRRALDGAAIDNGSFGGFPGYDGQANVPGEIATLSAGLIAF